MAACSCAGCASGGGCERYTSDGRAAAALARRAQLMDRARDLYARAGLRPYSVSVVRVRASGGRRRGDGVSDVVRSWAIKPTPKVADLTSLQEIVSADQVIESGSVLITGISLAYTEDVLLGRGADGTPIPSDEVVFYEVKFIGAGTAGAQRRRFVPSSAPTVTAGDAAWSITLTRAPVDRDRRGVPR